MTISILVHDAATGTMAAAAATGSLCVGGWVLRGDIDAGIVASQGTAPSTFWRDDGLRLLHKGLRSQAVCDALVNADEGRGHRQLALLDRTGQTAAFTGSQSVPHASHRLKTGLVVAGNMLTSAKVIDATYEAAIVTSPGPVSRMIRALEAAAAAGGDSRGLQSAAILVLRPDAPPVDLRIDYHDDPITALAELARRADTAPYSDWLAEVPTARDRFRAATMTEPLD